MERVAAQMMTSVPLLLKRLMDIAAHLQNAEEREPAKRSTKTMKKSGNSVKIGIHPTIHTDLISF
jgi:hypothetical protein